MCGRFALITDASELAQAFSVDFDMSMAKRYNIAPSQPVLGIVHNNSGRQAEIFSWGLLPSWAKDPSTFRRSINARAETVHTKPSFRAAFKRRRCLVPASGYYEWQVAADGKQPWYFHAPEHNLFAIAGVWEYFERDGSVVISLALLTTSANASVGEIHHRMPVIPTRSDYALWLDPETETSELQRIMQPGAEDALQAHPVSSYVNKPANNDERCIRKQSGQLN